MKRIELFVVIKQIFHPFHFSHSALSRQFRLANLLSYQILNRIKISEICITLHCHNNIYLNKNKPRPNLSFKLAGDPLCSVSSDNSPAILTTIIRNALCQIIHNKTVLQCNSNLFSQNVKILNYSCRSRCWERCRV